MSVGYSHPRTGSGGAAIACPFLVWHGGIDVALRQVPPDIEAMIAVSMSSGKCSHLIIFRSAFTLNLPVLSTAVRVSGINRPTGALHGRWACLLRAGGHEFHSIAAMLQVWVRQAEPDSEVRWVVPPTPKLTRSKDWQSGCGKPANRVG